MCSDAQRKFLPIKKWLGPTLGFVLGEYLYPVPPEVYCLQPGVPFVAESYDGTYAFGDRFAAANRVGYAMGRKGENGVPDGRFLVLSKNASAGRVGSSVADVWDESATSRVRCLEGFI